MFSTNSDDLPLLFHEPYDSIFDDLLRDCQNNNSECNNKRDEAANSDKVISKRQRKQPFAGSSKEEEEEAAKAKFEDGSNDINNNVSKKVVHREIERQRRQEMASLYASLRSLLPLEYIKGKRSKSDHMHQAVSYIKDMQKKIEKMQKRRETLSKTKRSSIERSSSSGLLGMCNRGERDSAIITVKVNPCLIGLEIIILVIIRCKNSNEIFHLSKVFVELVQRRLNVVSCDSMRFNDHKFVYKIEIEADELMRNMDPSELQDKLNDVMNE